MKKFTALFLAVVMILVPMGNVFADEAPEIYQGYRGVLSELEVMLDGEKTELESFLVSYWQGAGDEARETKLNVFKLRDLAVYLKDTDAKFNITYNKKDNVVEIVSGEEYEPILSDLTSVDISKASIKTSNQKVRVNGKDTEVLGVSINGHNYFRLSTIRSMLGNFMFKSDPKIENLAHIDVQTTDIKEFDEDEFKEILKEKDYTIVFNWGPWCYYSKRALPIMEDLQKYYDDKGDSVQIVGIVNQYDNYTLEDLKEMYGGKESPWIDRGATPEAYEYLEKEFGGSINFFPLRFIMDKEGNLVGKEFFDYQDIVGEEYMKEHGLTEETLTKEDSNAIEKKALQSFLDMAIEDK